ncbi:MAG TPA: hypothetical protein VHX11_01155 [Acidobacteriaceae bacterium]|jgi:hypothetical protein|nr:hypothetical protein [Acidobacteriaceae bacterium]
MLNLIGNIAAMATILIDAAAIFSAVALTTRQRLTAAGAAGAWVGLASALGANGALAFSPNQPIPVLGVLFATPLATAAILWRVSPGFRGALMAIPTDLLVGLNALRLLGGLFLGLAAVGRLSGPFPYSAALGDIATASLAIPLALRIRRGDWSYAARWNALGALDLVLAVGLGLTSAQGAPFQIFHGGAGSMAMQSLPFSLVPTVLVPFYLLIHGLIGAQLLARKRTRQDASTRDAIQDWISPRLSGLN